MPNYDEKLTEMKKSIISQLNLKMKANKITAYKVAKMLNTTPGVVYSYLKPEKVTTGKSPSLDYLIKILMAATEDVEDCNVRVAINKNGNITGMVD